MNKNIDNSYFSKITEKEEEKKMNLFEFSLNKKINPQINLISDNFASIENFEEIELISTNIEEKINFNSQEIISENNDNSSNEDFSEINNEIKIMNNKINKTLESLIFCNINYKKIMNFVKEINDFSIIK